MATIQLPITEEPSDLRNFINRITHGTRDDIAALTLAARALNAHAVHVLATSIRVGTPEQINIAATVAIGANLTTYTPVQNAMYEALLLCRDTFVHELVMPVIIDLAKCGSDAAGRALTAYIERGLPQQRLYAMVLKQMGIDVKRYRCLPRAKVVGEIGPR